MFLNGFLGFEVIFYLLTLVAEVFYNQGKQLKKIPQTLIPQNPCLRLIGLRAHLWSPSSCWEPLTYIIFHGGGLYLYPVQKICLFSGHCQKVKYLRNVSNITFPKIQNFVLSFNKHNTETFFPNHSSFDVNEITRFFSREYLGWNKKESNPILWKYFWSLSGNKFVWHSLRPNHLSILVAAADKRNS